MADASPLTFKVASEKWEFEQIHELNYQTFVDEIPQHQENEQGRLVDKFGILHIRVDNCTESYS